MFTKSTLALASICLIASSCSKMNEKHNMIDEISSESVQIELDNSGFEIEESQTLQANGDVYTTGEIQYVKNGEVKAIFNYGNGENDTKAILNIDGSNSEVELLKTDCQYKGKKSKYKKVIVRPLVKTSDCDYIVSGIIKYYELKTNEWLATIDFGNGTCDDLAEKETKEGVTSFKVSEYYK